VKLLTFVFHLFHAWLEDLSALVASGCKGLVVTFTAVESVIFRPERLVDQRKFAYMAEKAFLMPMFIFVRQILGVGSDFLFALFANMSELILIAIDAERMFFFQNIARSDQRLVTIPATKVVGIKILTHSFCVLVVID